VTALALVDVLGFWLGIFLTFCILSFLYKDNPFYKLAEHLFIGVSVGYLVIQQCNDNLAPKLVDAATQLEGIDLVVRMIALVLVALMFVKAISKRWAWLGRFPLAFVVAFYAGLQVNAVVVAELGEQIQFAAQDLDSKKVDLNTADAETLTGLPGGSPLVADKLIAERARAPFTSLDDATTRPSLTDAERADLAGARGSLVGLDAKAAVAAGERNWFGVLSNLLLLGGLLSALVYFYFSIAHTGVIGRASRLGVWVLMIGFGASFGLTVQGRLALAIGRAYDVLGRTVSPADAEQIQGPTVALVSIAIIAVGIVLWERRGGGGGGADVKG
jgi:DNA uptake protein ComE-like DNA-binding protein